MGTWTRQQHLELVTVPLVSHSSPNHHDHRLLPQEMSSVIPVVPAYLWGYVQDPPVDA